MNKENSKYTHTSAHIYPLSPLPRAFKLITAVLNLHSDGRLRRFARRPFHTCAYCTWKDLMPVSVRMMLLKKCYKIIRLTNSGNLVHEYRSKIHHTRLNS